jgi:hypothetical protein
MTKTPQDRFEALCDLETVPGCAIWKGGSLFRDASGLVPPRKFSYEQLHGPVPTHTRLQNTCTTKGCVHPAHLELADKSARTLQRVLRACAVVPGKPGCKVHSSAPYFQGAHPETLIKSALGFPGDDALIRSCGTPGCLEPSHLSSDAISTIYWEHCTVHPLCTLVQQTLQNRCVLYNGPANVGRWSALQAYGLEVFGELRNAQACGTPGCKNPNHYAPRIKRRGTKAERDYADALFKQTLRKAISLGIPQHLARNVARETQAAASTHYAASPAVRDRLVVAAFEAALGAARGQDGEDPGVSRLGDADAGDDLLCGEGSPVVRGDAPSDPGQLDSV